jgi:hypothetical protein
MGVRDILKLIEALAKAGKGFTPESMAALQGLLARSGNGRSKSSDVMTSVGPDNARAYTEILAGRNGIQKPQRPSPAITVAGKELLPGIRQVAGRDIVRVQMSSRTVQPFYRTEEGQWMPFSGVTVGENDQPSFDRERYASTGKHAGYGSALLKKIGAALAKQAIGAGLPDDLRNVNAWLGTSEASLINRGLDVMQAKGLVNLPARPSPAGGGPRVRPLSSLPSKPVIPVPERPASKPVIPIDDEPIDLPGPSVAADVKGLSWDERYQRLKHLGKLLPKSSVAARTLSRNPSQRDIIRESERQEQRLRDQDAAELARSKPVLPLNPEAPPIVEKAPEQKAQQTKLLDALKALTQAILDNKRPARTVAQEVAGLSWGERLKRLQAGGNLLSEDAVKQATLRSRVSPRDVILESERREQANRDQQAKAAAERRTKTIQSAAERLASFGGRIGGPRVAAMLQGASGRVAAGLTTSAAGQAAGGMVSGALGRLAMAGIANPYTALATGVVAATAALVKLPGAAERFSSSLLESRRHLQHYNGTIAIAFARLDYQQRMLDMRTANATAGSTSLVASSLENLRNERQWSREAMTTASNLGTYLGVQVGRVANYVLQNLWAVRAGTTVLKGIEKVLGGKPNDALNEHMRQIASGEWAQPKNRKPATRRSYTKKEE